jgi:hypothetical protein
MDYDPDQKPTRSRDTSGVTAVDNQHLRRVMRPVLVLLQSL